MEKTFDAVHHSTWQQITDRSKNEDEVKKRKGDRSQRIRNSNEVALF